MLALCYTNSFGGRLEEYPHPEADWAGFRALIERLNAGTDKVFSPVESGGMKHWIDLDRARGQGVTQTGGGRCGCSVM